MSAAPRNPAWFVVNVEIGSYDADRSVFSTKRGPRLHARVRPGDVLLLADYSWPLWLLGSVKVRDVMKCKNGTEVHGESEGTSWHPSSRIGFAGAFRYKSAKACPWPNKLGDDDVVRLTPEAGSYLCGLLSKAPTDLPSCFCGECQRFRLPERFRGNGFHLCKQCRYDIDKKRYGNRRGPLKKEEWNRCKAFFGVSCAYCGSPNELCQDHVFPRNWGGEDEAWNIIPACASCNSKKLIFEMESWFRSMPFFAEERLKRIQLWVSLNTRVDEPTE